MVRNCISCEQCVTEGASAPVMHWPLAHVSAAFFCEKAVCNRRKTSAAGNLKSGVMAKTELKIDAANLALRTASIVGVVYGIGFLLIPHSIFQLSEDPGAPTNSDGCAGPEGLFLVSRSALSFDWGGRA